MREYRARLGITQGRLAELVGARRETIVFLEKGKYNPSLRLAHAAARVLGATVDELFDFSDEEGRPPVAGARGGDA
jgi:putative transcriptional regulator